MKYTLSEAAALKVLLHAARHPSAPVNGLLLAGPSDAGVAIVDAVPLFHSSSLVGPYLETAIVQVRSTAGRVRVPCPA